MSFQPLFFLIAGCGLALLLMRRFCFLLILICFLVLHPVRGPGRALFGAGPAAVAVANTCSAAG